MREELGDGYYDTADDYNDCSKVRISVIGPDNRNAQNKYDSEMLMEFNALECSDLGDGFSIALDSILDVLVSADNDEVRQAVATAFGFEVKS